MRQSHDSAAFLPSVKLTSSISFRKCRFCHISLSNTRNYLCLLAEWYTLHKTSKATISWSLSPVYLHSALCQVFVNHIGFIFKTRSRGLSCLIGKIHVDAKTILVKKSLVLCSSLLYLYYQVNHFSNKYQGN